VYGDTGVIRAHARRMHERADDIRHDAVALLAQAEAVAWTGLAADAMRQLARRHAAALESCAIAHDDAAGALERHAVEVDRVKDLIAGIEHRAWGLLDSAASGLGGLVGHVLPDAVDRWAHDFDPPPHGSVDWLDVRLPSAS
jgi:hypothetical protein